MATDPHSAPDGQIENVCLTGGVVMAAFCTGLVLTAVIMWWALFQH